MALRPPKKRSAPVDRELVVVRWIDSSHDSGWTFHDDHAPLTVEDMVCTTVGFLYDEADHAISLVQSLSTSEQYDSIMTIPRVVILNVERLVRVPARRSRKRP